MTNLSGRFVLRVSPALHRELRSRATALGCSLNNLCQRLLSEGLLENGEFKSDYEAIVNKAQGQFGDQFIGLVLFGSQARGDSHDNSDTDLIIVLDPLIPIRRELYRAWPRNDDDSIAIHFASLPEDEQTVGSLWLECALDGIILSDPSQRIARKLRKIKAIITSGHVIRKTTHGQGYWVQV